MMQAALRYCLGALVVERTFGWFCRYRRLSKDYEYLTDCSEATIYLAMIHIMLRRLDPNAQPAGP
jgi:putative transposase